ncbi:hypothetical protein BDZ45DRAFT_651395 [Acephala macrosclerotiorum]|nr:hypothetical protein BDZ45DRAFT_651395 [Acephala macrosclerotiorum]
MARVLTHVTTPTSSIATRVSKALAVPWIEGDHLHSKESIAMVANGNPLTNKDRWLWLEAIRSTALLQLRESKVRDVVVTCSALEKSIVKLRMSRVMRSVFVPLEGESEVLREYMMKRESHYMGVRIVESQLESLELPGAEETVVIPIDATRSKEEVLEEVLGLLTCT